MKPTDLEKAVAQLTSRLPRLTELYDYYSGNHPLVYTSERLREIFRPLDARFTENWCSVVIDACADRITLQSLTVQDDESAQTSLNNLWLSLDMAIEADDVHDAALWAGEAYLVVWPDAETGETLACYNDPRMCYVEYAADNPKRKLWAAKWWEDEAEKTCYINLYYPDRIEYYAASREKTGAAIGVDMPAPQDRKSYQTNSGYAQQGGTGYKSPIEAKRFHLESVAGNPYGVIPVFHFKNKRCTSDLDSVIPIQNGINKLMVDLMVGAEFGAFPQKWAITQIELGSQTDANGAPTGNVLRLKNAPNEVWNLPASDGQGQPTSVGQFSPTDLGNFLSAIDRIIAHLAAITSTPKHYFFSTGGDPSGEALMTMEAPLNKKAQDRIDRFTPTWREVGAFLLQLDNLMTPSTSITPAFAKPQSVQPLTEAQIRQLAITAGIPLEIQLQDEGWTDAEIKALKAAKAEAQQQALANAQAMAATRPPVNQPTQN